MKSKVSGIVTLKTAIVASLPPYTIRLICGRAVVNGQVLVRPIFAPEKTTPKKLTFTTLLLFAKGWKFIAFWYLLIFLMKKRAGGTCGIQ